MTETQKIAKTVAVGSTQGEQDPDLGVELGDSSGGSTDQELLDDRAQGEELPLGRRARTRTAARCVGAWAVVVGVEDAALSRATSWCSAWTSPVTGSMTRSTRSRSSTTTVMVVPMRRFGTE